MKWLTNRLIPTFKKLFPHKKMALVLDNASYHHVRPDDWWTPSTMKKDQLASALVSLDINKIICQRKSKDGRVTTHMFTGTSFYSSKKGRHSPSADELRLELTKYLNEHPDCQTTKVQQLFDKHEYTLVYTPPYTPTTQPIEKVWGYVKNYVATLYKNGRTMDQLREQTLMGMYGDPNSTHDGVTADLCRKFIDKSHEWSNSFLADDTVLSGTLTNLGWNREMEYSPCLIDVAEEEAQEPPLNDDLNDNDGADAGVSGE
jgi:hypothetical protein